MDIKLNFSEKFNSNSAKNLKLKNGSNISFITMYFDSHGYRQDCHVTHHPKTKMLLIRMVILKSPTLNDSMGSGCVSRMVTILYSISATLSESVGQYIFQ